MLESVGLGSRLKRATYGWVLLVLGCMGHGWALDTEKLALTFEYLATKNLLHAHYSSLRMYETYEFQPLWNQKTLESLLQGVQNCELHGLNPADYHLKELLSDSADAIQRDIFATDAYLSLGGQLLGGKLNPVSMEQTWTAKGRSLDLVEHLAVALESETIAESLEALAPQHPTYKLLQKALAHYRTMEASGKWEKIPEGDMIRPGKSSPHIPAIRMRLVGRTLAESELNDSELYDDILVKAVKEFQKNANLEPDGLIGPATLQKLNKDTQELIDQLRVNLERWRWLPEDLGERYILVNIADYRLDAFENGTHALTQDVVVGRFQRQTPVFSATMRYMVLNPWWETPAKLARLDVLPKFQKDATAVETLGYQILGKNNVEVDPATIDWKKISATSFPYRIRQRPGPQNALGKVKFMFPNTHDVYLHDTPAVELFKKTQRDFSSGCIRVRNAPELARWVLKGQPEAQRLDEWLASGQEKDVPLRKFVRVHLLYWTVVVNAQGDGVRFIADVYDRDDRVLQALDAPLDGRNL